MEQQEKVKEGKLAQIGGLIFIGCMFLGAGIGMYFDALKIGGAIGMGVGFIGMAIIRVRSKK